MTLGIIREGKTPPDNRAPLAPEQCVSIQNAYAYKVIVQPAPHRCFSDDDYRQAGIELREDLSVCDIIFGVKEVPVCQLLEGKTYCFFSHTIKKQPHNQSLLYAILKKGIRLIDYEVLTDQSGHRIIAFGKFAGMVGAHNGLWTYGQRTGLFQIPRMFAFPHYADAVLWYRKNLRLPDLKIVLTGSGRVAQGAVQVLTDMGIRQVAKEEFLAPAVAGPVFTKLSSADYVARPDGSAFDKKEFYQHPQRFVSVFAPYTRTADIFINGIYWDTAAPAFFTLEEMCRPEFKIGVIADITCDIAPAASIPSTIRASTIENPVYGFDPKAKTEVPAHAPGAIDVMAIDNLPNELARDASLSFGQQLIEKVLPELNEPASEMIKRATVAEGGKLGEHFAYLEDYTYPASSHFVQPKNVDSVNLLNLVKSEERSTPPNPFNSPA